MKEKYEEPVVDVVTLEGDVITSSCNGGGPNEIGEQDFI